MVASEVLLERDLQTLIENNMDAFFGVRFLKSEYVITNGRMDSIGIDENNCPVIFEYKRSSNENVINQGLFYLDWLLDHKADFQLLVADILGQDTATSIDWSMPCVICIASGFTKYDLHAVNQMQRNIKLVRYQKYGNDLVLFEHLNAPAVPPIPVNNSGFSDQFRYQEVWRSESTSGKAVCRAARIARYIPLSLRLHRISRGRYCSEPVKIISRIPQDKEYYMY